MSDLSSFSHRVPQNRGANTSERSTSWRQILKRAMEQSMWSRNKESRVGTIEPNHMLSRLSSNQKFLILIACVLVCGVIVAFGIIRYLDLPTPPKNASAVTKGKSFLGITPSTTKPKPAPGKTFAEVEQAHPKVI